MIELKDGSCCCGGVDCLACNPRPLSVQCVDAGYDSLWNMRDPFNTRCGDTVCADFVVGGLYECEHDSDGSLCCVWRSPTRTICTFGGFSRGFYIEAQLCETGSGDYEWRVAFVILNGAGDLFQSLVYTSDPFPGVEHCRDLPVTCHSPTIFSGTTGGGIEQGGCVWGGADYPSTVQLVECE